MPTVWSSLKKSFYCKSGAEDVHDPRTQKSSRERRRVCVLKNYVHPNITRSALMPSSCSPQSVANGEFPDPVSLHEVIANDSRPSRRPSESNPGSARPSPSSDRCAVSELCKVDFSRNIVEIIFRPGWPKPCGIGHHNNNFNNNNNIFMNSNGRPCERIQRVLKVHNMQATVARFEEYREMVKARASGLSRKHARCMADGNELLRFHGTTLSCSLGTNGDSNPCTMAGCNVCRIIRTGFSDYEGKRGENSRCTRGIYMTATSGRAHEYHIAGTLQGGDHGFAFQRAMVVCRVIAGRILNNPVGKFDALPFPIAKFWGFDSVAGESEELFVFNSRAVLPCFVVIYRSD